MATTADPGTVESLDDREARALTEPMDVFADDPATDEHEVAVYNDGTRYIVNPEAGWCSCDDWHYRQPEGGCKHQARVAFERGEREIPDWIDEDALDDWLEVDF